MSLPTKRRPPTTSSPKAARPRRKVPWVRHLPHDTMACDPHPASGIDKEVSEAPQRDKQPGSLGQPVIARGRLEATETLGRDATVRLDSDFDVAGPPVPIAVEANHLENKTGEM